MHRASVLTGAVLLTALVPPFASLALTQDAATAQTSVPLSSPGTERRIDALLRQMTLAEKVGQLVQYNDQGGAAVTASDDAAPSLAANPEVAERVDAMKLAAAGELGSMLNTIGAAKTHAFQRAAVEQSRLHIPLLFGADVIHGYRTIYPIPLGLAASFDPEMVTKVSRMAALEATTAGVRWFYSPMVDISRDARWGRSSEGAGEDPYLGAAMARAYIRGYQGQSLADARSVAASVKHFAAYGAAEAGREYNTTDMSDVRLRQVYLPPYQAAVASGAATMMSSFNALNGVPATSNPYLMTEILRREWGFQGFVVSDYTAVKELLSHGIARTPAEATRKALTAGTDVDMMSHFYDTQIPGLIKDGGLSMATVDEAVRRVLRVKFALGLFEHPYERGSEVTEAVAEHRPAVRAAAEESFVLLRNERTGATSMPTLPLQANRSLALIGPLADDSGEMQGAWGGGSRVKDVVTVRDALQARATAAHSAFVYAKGTEIDGTSEAGFAEALAAARQADVVVMALGESSLMSGEAGSRAHLDLPGNQQALLEQVVAVGKPVVLLVFSGRPLVLTWSAQHVASLMEVWFPGTEAGNAVARVLYGEVAPSGKLPMSFPATVGQEPLYYNQFPTGRPAGEADLSKPPDFPTRFISRYIDAPNKALYTFGYGLSYTDFAYTGVQLAASPPTIGQLRKGGSITVTSTVRNTGTFAATEVVQCYLRNVGASLEQPTRELKGFARVALAPGESRPISFQLGFPELAFYDAKGERTLEATHYTAWVGGSSQATEHVEFDLHP